MAGTIVALAGGAVAWIAGIFNGQQPLLSSIGDINTTLLPLLSDNAAIWMPGTRGFEVATQRWSPRINPQFDLVVDVASEEDVSHTIRYANAKGMPFLALSGKHGYNVNLNKVKHGVGINMRAMDTINLVGDGTTATIGGGIRTKAMVHELWEMDKITTTGCCECTGAVAPMLGGGHGWLQGQYGLMADNLVSARLVLANGSAITVSDAEHADLFWALRGAGHNFGIVTNFEYKVYDRTKENENFALETLIFTGDKLEDVFSEANKLLLTRPVELTWFAMLFPMPDVDPVKPVIIFILVWQGASIPKKWSTPFTNLQPIVHTNANTDLLGLAAQAGFSNDSPACQRGTVWVPYPAGTVGVPISGIREAYKIQTSLPASLNESWTIIEGYSMATVQAVESGSTAFPERQNRLLISPFMQYKPTGNVKQDERGTTEGFKYGKLIRDAIGKAAEDKTYAYVNYNSANEDTKAVYGHESWRLEKLIRLKREYDPERRFGFYNPI